MNDRFKSSLGHCRSRIARRCDTCGGAFTAEVRKVEAGTGRFCSKRCNPSYQPREPHSVKVRRQNLKSNYGLTPAAYDKLAKAQSGLCVICKQPPLGKRKLLCVDHSRASGKVRALLCLQCNTGLGMFKEDPSRLRAAVRYLERHPAPYARAA